MYQCVLAGLLPGITASYLIPWRTVVYLALTIVSLATQEQTGFAAQGRAVLSLEGVVPWIISLFSS